MLDGVLEIAVLLVSVILHENAHGVVALALGDRTAKASGRITLNPLKHLDPVGSLILPAFLFVVHAPVFGYAKPVPVSPHNLKGKDRWGFATVALAGPVCNVLIAIVCITALRLQGGLVQVTNIRSLNGLLFFAFTINIFLAAFNLLPIPPLDGSRLLRPFIGAEGRRVLDRIEPFGFVILLLLISTSLSEPLFRIVNFIQHGILNVIPLPR